MVIGGIFMGLTSPRFINRGESTIILENCLNGTRTVPPKNGQEIETDTNVVKMLQRAFVDLGYLSTYDEVDGQFGPKTSKAVSRYKQDRNIFPADGVVGPKTSRALDAEFPTRPENLGPFQPFVDQNRLDRSIADLLNELRGFSFLSWAGQTAEFALHELNNHNLVGIVPVSKAHLLKDRLPEPIHKEEIDKAVNSMNSDHSTVAITGRIQQPNWLRGFILIRDDTVSHSTPGDEKHIEVMLDLAHELTHFRNRVLTENLLSEPITADQYLNTTLADQLFFEEGVRTQSVRMKFIEEICCRHVSWRVHQDLIEDHARKQINAGIVRPHALEELKSPLSTGRLFHAVLKLAETFNIYSDNGYMQSFFWPRKPEFNRQAAIWFRTAERMLFHDDETKNNEVRTLINNEFAAAQPDFKTPEAIPMGLDFFK